MKKVGMLLMLSCLLCVANSADAGVLGRHLGLGWGDGYHAQCGCDDRCRGRLLHRLFRAERHCGKGKGDCGKGKGVPATWYGAQPAMPPIFGTPTYVPQPEMLP